MIDDFSTKKGMNINANMKVDTTHNKHLKIRMPEDTAGANSSCFIKNQDTATTATVPSRIKSIGASVSNAPVISIELLTSTSTVINSSKVYENKDVE